MPITNYLCKSVIVTCLTFRAALCTPNLATVFTKHNPCRYNLVFNNISIENLPTTRNIPITLTKRDLSTDANPPLQLDIVQNKGWFCETVILFVTINSPYLTASDTKAIGYWILTQGRYYFRINSIIDLDLYPDNLYLLLIPSDSKVLLSNATAQLYTLPSKTLK